MVRRIKTRPPLFRGKANFVNFLIRPDSVKNELQWVQCTPNKGIVPYLSQNLKNGK